MNARSWSMKDERMFCPGCGGMKAFSDFERDGEEGLDAICARCRAECDRVAAEMARTVKGGGA